MRAPARAARPTAHRQGDGADQLTPISISLAGMFTIAESTGTAELAPQTKTRTTSDEPPSSMHSSSASSLAVISD